MNPEQLDENGYTIAMKCALEKKPIEFIYGHDPSLKSKDGKTVEDILKETNQEIPYCWKIKQDPTEQVAQFCKDPKSLSQIDFEFIKNPYFRLPNGDTFLIYFIKNGMMPPISSVYHSPYLRFENGRTAAMIWATYLGKNIPKFLNHDPMIQDNLGYTVSMILKLRYENFTLPFWEYKNKSSIKTSHNLSSASIEKMMSNDGNIYI